MNWKTAFFICLVALVGTAIWAFNCYDNPPCSGDSFCDGLPPDSVKISLEQAVIDTLLFRDFRDTISINAPNDTLVVDGDSVAVIDVVQQLSTLRGFKLKHLELATMLQQEGCDIDVWALLVIKNDSTHEDYGKFDLIFQVRAKNEDGALADGGDGFYDFTDPCPPSCPGGGDE